MFNLLAKKELVAYWSDEGEITHWGKATGGVISVTVYFYVQGTKRSVKFSSSLVDETNLPPVMLWLNGGALPKGVVIVSR